MKFVISTILFISLNVLMGCFDSSTIDHSDPVSVFMMYDDLLSNEDYEGAYKLLSSPDRSAMTPSEFAKVNTYYEPVTARYWREYKKISKATAEIIEGNDKVVELKVTYSNPVPASESERSIYYKPTQDDVDVLTNELLSGKYTFETRINSVFLVNESENNWSLYLNLEKVKKIEKLRKEAENLHNTAIPALLKKDIEWLERKSDLLKARKIYEELEKLGQDMSWDKSELEEKLKIIKDFEMYSDDISISNITTGKDYDGEHAVWGELKNHSNVAYSSVDIRVYLLDKNGAPCHEYDFFPIHTKDNGIKNSSLKANYSKTFGYRLKSPPSTWNGKVKVVVSSIRME